MENYNLYAVESFEKSVEGSYTNKQLRTYIYAGEVIRHLEKKYS